MRVGGKCWIDEGKSKYEWKKVCCCYDIVCDLDLPDPAYQGERAKVKRVGGQTKMGRWEGCDENN